jgi:uncharacterized protein (TIGR00299 family) protein
MKVLFTQNSPRHFLLIDAVSGISGDMFLAALSDLGFDLSSLQEVFRRHPEFSDLTITQSESASSGMRGVRINITAKKNQPARTLSRCQKVVEELSLPAEVASLACRSFHRLAAAEAAVHGCTIEQVHFHEIGAIDTLVDLVGASLGLYSLRIAEMFVSNLCLGRGTIKTAHGTLPVPAPATLELLRGFEAQLTEEQNELTTPTGAVILAATARMLPPSLRFKPLKIGYGAGSIKLQRPNVLRLTLAERVEQPCASVMHSAVSVIKCAIDNMPGERFGHLMEQLFHGGALDVYYSPVQMKKNRPGVMVEVLCREADIEEICTLIFKHSTTIGLRIDRENRVELPRESFLVNTCYGEIRVKKVCLPDGNERLSPEYDDCATAANTHGVSLAEVQEVVRHETKNSSLKPLS